MSLQDSLRLSEPLRCLKMLEFLSVCKCSRTRLDKCRVREHLHTDKNSNIFKHLRGSDKRRESCSDNCFTVIDTASTYHQLKIKEALHISWEKPILNKQVQHFDISLTF